MRCGLGSACCTGRQGAALLSDGDLPTCRPGLAAPQCTRAHWHGKLLGDLLAGYDSRVAPSTAATDPLRYGGVEAGCLSSIKLLGVFLL